MLKTLKERPDHHDAELVFRAYELRREATMRESRTAINGQFWPATETDLLAVTEAGHPLNAPFRQVGTYWEMVYGIARQGIVHADYFLESNGEGLFLFAKVRPHLGRLRELSPYAFRNAEWAGLETTTGQRYLAMFEARVKKKLGG